MDLLGMNIDSKEFVEQAKSQLLANEIKNLKEMVKDEIEKYINKGLEIPVFLTKIYFKLNTIEIE